MPSLLIWTVERISFCLVLIFLCTPSHLCVGKEKIILNKDYASFKKKRAYSLSRFQKYFKNIRIFRNMSFSSDITQYLDLSPTCVQQINFASFLLIENALNCHTLIFSSCLHFLAFLSYQRLHIQKNIVCFCDFNSCLTFCLFLTIICCVQVQLWCFTFYFIFNKLFVTHGVCNHSFSPYLFF